MLVCLVQVLILVGVSNGVRDRCYHKKMKIWGTCVDIKQCKGVEEDLRENITPQLCKTRRKPTVCCPPIAEHKCHQYTKKVNEKISALVDRFGVDSKDRIVGGSESSLGDFPHFVVLGYGNPDERKWLCGGTLISENFVLTAAHCIRQDDPVKRVQLGDVELDGFVSKTYDVKTTYSHANYKNRIKHHDIALVALTENVEFSQYIKPACLPTKPDIQKKLIVCGFGYTENFGTQSETLKHTTVDLFTNSECKNTFQRLNIVEDFQICFGSKSKKRSDSCDGDSGGPLQQYDTDVGLHRVFGIVSFGALGFCGTPGLPAVYTRVHYYVSWIEEMVWKRK